MYASKLPPPSPSRLVRLLPLTDEAIGKSNPAKAAARQQQQQRSMGLAEMVGVMWSSVRRGRRASYAGGGKAQASAVSAAPSTKQQTAKPGDPQAGKLQGGCSSGRLPCRSRRREDPSGSDSEGNKENACSSNSSSRSSRRNRKAGSCLETAKPSKPAKMQRRLSGLPIGAGGGSSSRQAAGGGKTDSREKAADAAGNRRIHRELRGLDLAAPLKSRRTSAYLLGWSLNQKLELLLQMGVVALTEVNDSEEVHTLSICGQFAEENHLAMLQDSDRVSHYRKAMQWTGEPSSGGRKLVEGRRVLEIGTGPVCLLSINAVNAGAAHVVALEASRPSHCRAKKFVEAIGMSHKIDVVQGFSKRIPAEVFKKPELIIHEIIGDFASQEGVADAILDVQRRTGTLPLSIPFGAETLVCPASLPEPEHFLYPAHSYEGRSILSPRRILLQSVRLNTSHLLLSDGFQAFETLHFQKPMSDQMEQRKTLTFVISKPGCMAGLLAVIKIEIFPGQYFGTFRNGETDSWYTSLVLLPEEVDVEAGDTVKLESFADLRNYSSVGPPKQMQKSGAKTEASSLLVSKPTYTFTVSIFRPSFSLRKPLKSFAPIVVSFEEQAPVLCGATRKYAERRRQTLRSAAAACCLFFLFSSAHADSQMSLTAFRPLQFEAAPGFPLGPWGRAALLGAPVCSCEQLLAGMPDELPVGRRFLCVSKATALTADEVGKLLGTSHFVLLLLPASGVHLDAVSARQVRGIERMLLDRHSAAAVAFARETPDLKALLLRLQTDGKERLAAQTSLTRPFLSASSHYKQEWQPLKGVRGVTLTAWLAGHPQPEGGGPNPALLIVAHHDAFASVPHFATGVSQGASGAIALMWLARELRKLYKQNQVEYSVGFVLADASALNYDGVAQWIGQADPRLLNATRYVLCLDDLASSSLSLHTPKSYKDPEVARLLVSIENALRAEGVRLTTRTKRIAAGGKLLPLWPHEHFTRAKLIAGSLAAEEEFKHLWNRASLADSRLDGDALTKTVRGLAEGVARFLLSVQQTEKRLTGRESDEHLQQFITSWAQLSLHTPRQADSFNHTTRRLRLFFAYRDIPSYGESPSANSRYLKSLSDELENAGLAVERHEFAVDMGGFSFSYEAPVTIYVAEARPVFFDWLLLLCSLAYSLSLFLIVKGISKADFLSRTRASQCASPQRPPPAAFKDST
ncbi:hypothetical protein Efla_001493 [Eimeria flavescens]